MEIFTKVMREQQMKSRNQLGINMIGLITWMILAVAIMGGVVALFTSTSQQTAMGAEQNQQQQSILNALNRVSRDVSISNPIIYASSTEIVMDVNKEDGTSVDRRRYLLNLDSKEVWEYSKPIQRGAPYDNAGADAYWNTSDVNRKAKTVYSVDTDVAQTPNTAFLKYYDSKGAPITGVISTSKAAEAIARVDIALTADIANKGKVSLSTSAVPRATTNLGATAQPILAPCPAFTATRTGTTVVLRWDKAADDVTSYEITRNGVTIQPTTLVSDNTQQKYTYTDTPGTSSTVMNYMLKVVSAAGISNCIDSVRPIVITAGSTQLDSELVPKTTVDGSGNPVSTAWSNAGETTQVSLKWKKVDIATGYVIYRQRLNADGSYNGDRKIEATLDTYPYVDQNSSTLAPTDLSYVANANWDEYWEWTIKVMARTGDNEETPETRTLSYPNPVNNASISALPVKAGSVGKVSDADLAAGKGNTKVTWTYTAGMEARGFDIYRSAIDTPAANFPAGFTKIGSADAGTSEYIDRNAELGSTYGYYVVAKNKSGFSNSYASQRVQQLQFPPDPKVATVSAAGSRDLNDGTNRSKWSPAKSATGYHVWRINNLTNATSCLTGDCDASSGGLSAAATYYDDSRPEISPATRFTYAVYSYNPTGLSPKLAANVTLTQRPTAPTLNKTASPTLNSLTTSMSWNSTAGSWCVSGAYTGGGNNCTYEQRQYSVNGSLRYAGTSYTTSFNWGNQDWGRHYTYDVRAQNAAITNGGWSELSGTVQADTYPGNFGVNFGRGDASGNNSQRFIYNSSFITTNTSETDHTRKFDGAAVTTIAWGTPAGSRTVRWERFPEGGGSSVASGNSSLYLPSSTYLNDWVDWGATNRATSYAAPGAAYSAKVTAWSIENNLTRSIDSASNVVTPADMPQSGYMQMVCSGPWDATPYGYDQASAIEYAKRSFSPQSYGSRLQNLDKSPRYGWFSDTVIQGKYQDASGIGSNYWYQGPDGRYWYVERLAKGSVGYYQNGNGGVWSSNQGNPNGYDGNNIGEATHRYNVGHGFTLYNRLWSDPALNSYWMFILMDEAATRGGCGDGYFIEPYDACYEWDGTSGCFQLNQNGYDGRPRWTTK